MKTFTFTTLDAKRNEVETYTNDFFNLNEAKDYAKKIVANSQSNEVSNTRIKLVK